MTVLQIMGLADGWLQFDDGSGPNELPTNHIHALAHNADASDADFVPLDGRPVATQTLLALRRYLDELEMPRCDFCHDAPGTEQMGDDKRACPACCSGAQGSRYDDREAGI